MKRLQIPQPEKDKGLIWVEYEVVEVGTTAEIQIQQGLN